MHYEQNKDRINAQKRAAYAERKADENDTNRIDIDLIIKISRALGVTADDLLAEELKPLHPNHKMHLELLENNHIYGRLLDAAAGCTDDQIVAAINLLNAFKNPDSYIYSSSTPHN